MTAKRIDVIDLACEEYSQEVLGDNKLLVIIAKDLSVEEKTALITVLKSHKRAITWKLSDLKAIDPKLCTHKIFLEEDFEPAVQHQRSVNPKIHDVIKQECTKEGRVHVVENEDNELIPNRLVTGWRVCIDYHKLNEATRKGHLPLQFMDHMLERLAQNQYYCFLDGFFGYFQIPIDPKDQEKTTFTCPYETFAYRRMPFGLCNGPGTFQRKDTEEVSNTNLCLNWEKSHFMVKEGIVLIHKISKQGIEVDKAKMDVITKLPHPTTVKGFEFALCNRVLLWKSLKIRVLRWTVLIDSSLVGWTVLIEIISLKTILVVILLSRLMKSRRTCLTGNILTILNEISDCCGLKLLDVIMKYQKIIPSSSEWTLIIAMI
nr:reverse transcriptase domain-containing protein [Tanacetum cinerariifolium]